MKVSLGIPVARDAPAVARDRLRTLAGLIATDQYEDLRLVVSELVANAVVHGPQANAIIDVRITVVGDRIHGSVTDAGPGFTYPQADMELHNPFGRGLFMVAAVVKRWGIHPSAPTTVWFELAP